MVDQQWNNIGLTSYVCWDIWEYLGIFGLIYKSLIQDKDRVGACLHENLQQLNMQETKWLLKTCNNLHNFCIFIDDEQNPKYS